MKVKQNDRTKLVIEDFPLLLGVIFFPAALFVFYKIIQRLLEQAIFDKDLLGMIVGFLGFFLAGALSTERSLFIFKIYEQRLTWKRQGLFAKKGGEVPFDNIKNVVLQIGHGGGRAFPPCRLAIITKDKTIPMTRYYRPDVKGDCKTIKNTILDTIKKEGSRFVEDSILEMLASGRKIDAMKLAQTHYKMNATEANKFLENLLK